ncbi:MAG: hypothetical protein IPO27_12805 [Bacteroidetes bacterium]|nr:hypothetical protein [Bacteroidota bacterium]
MKRFFFAALAASTLMIACKDYKQELDSANRLNAELQAQTDYKDSTINDFIKNISDIESGLNAITDKQDAVQMQANDNENRSQARERILGNISEIELMLKENKEKLAALQARLSKSGVKIKALEEMITALNSQIAMRDSSIVLLTGQIEGLNTKVASLSTTIDTMSRVSNEKTDVINKQIATMHTAYYTKGNMKDLILKKVVSKTGGFLGMGKSQKLTGDFESNNFTQIDITTFSKIDINSKYFELATAHPSDSYKINKVGKDMVTDMEITNPDKFWSASKYLVIVTGK